MYNFHRGWILRTPAKGEQPKPTIVEVLESRFESTPKRINAILV